MKQKPTLSFWQIWNLSFGFLGIQIGYSLQSSQTSRILSGLGADLSDLSYYWLAAPLAGLIVQPFIGMSSDKTWTKLGRRIPFILGGAIISAIAMIFFPNSEFIGHIMPPIYFGAFMLLFMDCAFNVAMQPFRSLVGDMVNDQQRNKGYSIQSLITNIGAVLGFLLPITLAYIGIRNEPLIKGVNEVVPTLKWAYFIGAIILLASVLWTSFKVKEYPPKEHAEYNNITKEEKVSFLDTLKTIPKTMYQLAIVQFFSWFALFIMWVYIIDGITDNVLWDTTETSKDVVKQIAGNWNGVLGAVYGGIAAIFSMFMGRIADTFGRKKVYSMALLMGAIGLFSVYFFKNQYLLLISQIGIGIAWAGILAMPYAILSKTLPANKMGVYMGVFNATITIPQIAAGLMGGLILKHIAGGSPILMLAVAGVAMLLAAVSVIFVQDSNKELEPESVK